MVALDDTVSEVADRGGGRTLAENLADPDEGPGALMELAEMRQLLAEAIGGMPERERMVLSLYY